MVGTFVAEQPSQAACQHLLGPTSSDCSEDGARISEECHDCVQEATRRDEVRRQSLPLACGELDILSAGQIGTQSNCLEAGKCAKSIEAQGTRCGVHLTL